MRAVICPEFGKPGVLRVQEISEPVLGPGQVRVRVNAAGVNFADIMKINGTYQYKSEPPFVPGMELAGMVEECGAGVTMFRPGDRVCGGATSGAFAEIAVVEAADLHLLPDNMDIDQAAAFPIAYGTSHLGLEERGRLQAGETLLVLGAGGGVGLTAVEIGKRMGAKVIASAGSDDRLAAALSQGADHVIDHRSENIRDRVKALTDGRGADLIYDPVGGGGFYAAFRAVARSGRVLIVGFASGEVPQIPANIVLVKNLSILGYVWGSYREFGANLMRQSMTTLLKWYEEGSLRPRQPMVMDLDQATEALTALVERRVTGKLVLRVE